MNRIQSAFLLFLLASHVSLLAQYSVTPIATGSEWANSQATAINSFGDVAGIGYSSGNDKVFLYKNGTLTNLGTLGGGSAYVFGMNDLGDVVGMSPVVNGGNTHAFLYSDGQMRDLGALSSGFSTAKALNNTRRVVGRAPTSYPGGTIAFYHDENSAFLQELGNFPGATVREATDVNTLGNIVGWITGYGTNMWTRTFFWSNGLFVDIGAIIGSSYSVPTSMNDRNDVVGHYHDTNSVETGFLYADGKIKSLGVGIANSINNLGQIVGESHGTPYLRDYGQDTNIDVNTLVSTNSGWTVLHVSAINDAGQIAAIGRTNGTAGPIRALLLTPPSRLVAPTITGNQFQFTLQSLVSRTNQIQVSSNLVTWLPFAEIVASVPLTSISTNLINNASQFFRISN